MNWTQLLSDERLEKTNLKPENFRSEFQRDFDRIVFSNAFRRLQGKTQVFSLPENDVIHNRLTHSLEVSCVGRSLGTKIGFELKNNLSDPILKYVNEHDIGVIVASSCLTHDIGNPPFGHNGEKIIQDYFKKNTKFLLRLSSQEKNDLTQLDGNALGLRLLNNKKDFNLTVATLASFIKYPISSDFDFKNKTSANYIGFKKTGIFKSEVGFLNQIAQKTGLIKAEQKGALVSFYRHPLNFLVEAADDICYNIIDLEDAYRSKIISSDTMKTQLARFIPKKYQSFNLSSAKLRALAINYLTKQVSQIFLENYTQILTEPWEIKQSLIEKINEIDQFIKLKEFSKEIIYKKQSLFIAKIDKFSILNNLLDYFLNNVFDSKSNQSKNKKTATSDEYQIKSKNRPQSDYDKIMLVVEFIAGMTDQYAIKIGQSIAEN